MAVAWRIARALDCIAHSQRTTIARTIKTLPCNTPREPFRVGFSSPTVARGKCGRRAAAGTTDDDGEDSNGVPAARSQFAQRPGDAIHGCTVSLLPSRGAAIWPELGNESFQTMHPMRHVGSKPTCTEKGRGRHPSTHDATYLRPRIDRPRGKGRPTAAQTSFASRMFRMGKSAQAHRTNRRNPSVKRVGSASRMIASKRGIFILVTLVDAI